MEKRPKIKLELSTADKLLEIITGVLIFAMWALVLITYDSLPENIPTHYNGTGEADAYGKKSAIFGLPIVATVLYLGLSFLNQFPHTFNYPCEITEKNAHYQYQNSTRMLRFFKLVIVIIFGMICIITLKNSHQKTTNLGNWFLPLTMGLILVPLIYFLIRSYREKVQN